MPSSAAHPPVLPSFPTRRSSDLRVLPSRGVPTLVALGALAAALFAFRGFLDTTRARILVRIGSFINQFQQSTPDRCLNSCRNASFRSEEHTSELQSLRHLVCRLLPPTLRSSPLSLHDALPISACCPAAACPPWLRWVRWPPPCSLSGAFSTRPARAFSCASAASSISSSKAHLIAA